VFLKSVYTLNSIANTWFSSPTMARASAAKATGNPETNFMAAGEMSPQALYG
jgi:NADH dehydrogenase (ubiquinone) Fe-S protein 1